MITTYFLVRAADLRSGADPEFLMPSRASDKVKRRKVPEPYINSAKALLHTVRSGILRSLAFGNDGFQQQHNHRV